MKIDKPMSETMKVLDGLVVVDAGVGMAAALIAKFLAEQGANVIRIEPPGGDPFHKVYPAYRYWRRFAGQADAANAQAPALLLQTADIILVGGEDHPDAHPASLSLEAIRNERLITLEIESYPPDLDAAGAGVDILVQARTGLAWAQFGERPNLMAFHPTGYGACLNALRGLMIALYEREQSGLGQHVRTSLFEGALAFSALWNRSAERPNTAFNIAVSKDAASHTYRCKDGTYIQMSVGSASARDAAERVLAEPGSDQTADPDPGSAIHATSLFANSGKVASQVSGWDSQPLLEALLREGGFVAPVLAPGACWEDQQVQHNGIIWASDDGTRFVGAPLSIQTQKGGEQKRPPIMSRAPLQGLKTLDFGTFVAGPCASVPLADFGAEVLKVEPVTGDPMRPHSGPFTASNRGKRGVALNLKTDIGAEIAHTLCRSADVVSSNFRPGVGHRLGIDAKSIHNSNPGAIILETSAYGATGPYALRGGFDGLFQAFCGLAFCAGGKGNPPLWNRASIVDFTTGALGAIGTIMGLYHRARTGEGCAVEVSLLDSSLFLMSALIQRSDGIFIGAETLNAQQTGYHPAESLYQTADGWLAIAVRGGEQARGLAAALNLGDQLSSNFASWNHGEAKAIGAATRQLSTRDTLDRLRDADVWAEACISCEEATTLREPSLWASSTVVRADDPDLGAIFEVGSLCRFSRSQSVPGVLPPFLGEHTREVLHELGYEAAEIDRLASCGVIN